MIFFPALVILTILSYFVFFTWLFKELFNRFTGSDL